VVRLNFFERGIEMNEIKVKYLESFLNRKIPENIVKFLNDYNINDYSYLAFSLSANTSSILQKFFTFSSVDDDIVKQNELHQQRLPEGLLAIGMDTFGNLVAVDLNANNCIWFFEHDKVSEEGVYQGVKLGGDIWSFASSLHKNFEGKSYLELFIESCSLEGLKDLLEKGYNPESLDIHGRNLLEQAVVKNRVDLVEYLIEQGCSVRNAKAIVEDNLLFFPEYEELHKLMQSMRS
jgi:hypothetical protein